MGDAVGSGSGLACAGAFQAAYGWTTCSLHHRIHAARCLRMRSSAPASSSALGVGSTGYSRSSFGFQARRLTTGEAPMPMLSLSFQAGQSVHDKVGA